MARLVRDPLQYRALSLATSGTYIINYTAGLRGRRIWLRETSQDAEKG